MIQAERTWRFGLWSIDRFGDRALGFGMRPALPRWIKGRAIIAVVAFYALSLQAFFAAATPMMAPDPGAVTCHDTGAPKNDVPLQHQHQCCLAACPQALIPPVPSSFAIEAWPPRVVTKLLWRAEASAEATGPPRGLKSARGPPAA
jgi:hypothetical protein